MRTKTITTAATILVLTVTPTVASADFALEFGLGVNGVVNDDYADDIVDIDLNPLIGLHLGAHYKPLRFFSVGALIHYGFIWAGDDDLDHEYSGFFAMLAEARGHFPIGRFEPWVGFGIGYANAHTRAEGSWWIFDGEGAMVLHGVGIGLSTGIRIAITDTFGINPFFRVILGAYPTACYRYRVGDGEEKDCDDTEDIYGDDPDDWPHLWIVGIAASNVF